jgi:hypothetical protein
MSTWKISGYILLRTCVLYFWLIFSRFWWENYDLGQNKYKNPNQNRRLSRLIYVSDLSDNCFFLEKTQPYTQKNRFITGHFSSLADAENIKWFLSGTHERNLSYENFWRFMEREKVWYEKDETIRIRHKINQVCCEIVCVSHYTINDSYQTWMVSYFLYQTFLRLYLWEERF